MNAPPSFFRGFMKYAYVVTRIMFKFQDGVMHIPNLGVHSSYKKAKKHFNSVVKDRQKTENGYKVHRPTYDTPVSIMDEHSFPNIGEWVRLERWQVRDTKK